MAIQSRQEIQQRVLAGLDKSFDRSTDLTLYLRACERMLREGRSAQTEDNFQQAYFILLRLVELIVTYIPRHPQAKDARYAQKVKTLSRKVPDIMAALSVLKEQIDVEYAQFRTMEVARQDARAKIQAASRARQRELEQAQSTITADKISAISPRPDLESVRKRLDALAFTSPLQANDGPGSETSTYVYPSMEHEPMLSVLRSDFESGASPTVYSSKVPQRPPKLPVKVTVEKSALPPEHQFESSATLENNEPLKNLFVPSALRSAFLKIAQVNTDRKLETCGILSGILRNNAYFVTTLIVPAQDSTSDTCHTTDEEALFTYQDSHDLFTLGWIHTHPTQTCFLSSVDLHTQCSYQLMLPESVAIVCSPSKVPAWGVFRLTNPPGVRVVKDCRQNGLFHPHSEDHIYVAAGRDVEGHVRELDGMTFTIEDQRK